MANLETRVARIAEATLAEGRSVRPIDVLVGLGWLAQPNVDRWVQGRVPSLDRCLGVDSDKVPAALSAMQHWAEDRGLTPSEADDQDLQFTADGDSDAERAYRTHWASTDIPEPVVERPRRPRRIIVISPHNARTCTSCDDTGDFLVKDKAGALCLDCADLGHLEFLPSGDPALTRRATKASRLSAVVVRWSTRRNRYEHQGILAEPAAIEQAAQECLSDADLRARRGTREQSRRADQDVRFCGEFAAAIREQFPGCPADRAEAIALHAAARGSGRVGRSAAGRALDPDAVDLAVVASVRHVDTDYDALLMSGVDRESARAQVHQQVASVVFADVDVAQPVTPAFDLTHEKSMVIDGELAFTESLNWTDENFTETRDYAVVTPSSHEIAEIVECFEADWHREEFDPGGGAHLIWRPTNGRHRIADFIDTAEHTLFVQNERYQDPVIIERLVRAARRGVKVHIMARAPHHLKANKLLEGVSGLRILDDVGLKIHRLKHLKLHAKMTLADHERAIVGSINLSPGSFDHRRELAIEARDHHLLKRLNEVAHHDWTHSEPLDLSDAGLLADLARREDRRTVDQLALHDPREERD